MNENASWSCHKDTTRPSIQKNHLLYARLSKHEYSKIEWYTVQKKFVRAKKIKKIKNLDQTDEVIWSWTELVDRPRPHALRVS